MKRSNAHILVLDDMRTTAVLLLPESRINVMNDTSTDADIGQDVAGFEPLDRLRGIDFWGTTLIRAEATALPVPRVAANEDSDWTQVTEEGLHPSNGQSDDQPN